MSVGKDFAFSKKMQILKTQQYHSKQQKENKHYIVLR